MSDRPVQPVRYGRCGSPLDFRTEMQRAASWGCLDNEMELGQVTIQYLSSLHSHISLYPPYLFVTVTVVCDRPVQPARCLLYPQAWIEHMRTGDAILKSCVVCHHIFNNIYKQNTFLVQIPSAAARFRRFDLFPSPG